ncbi:MAG: 7-carboxy-7-deazaguanine synthase [Saprospiraceae bacterium]|nr:7-carboxy-7-deazaguanine synthase [Saprospiraceae bacterium]
MMYSVKEIFYTLQGEGKRSGRPAVFLRFSGCNLWNGKESDREFAICNFCDTDFIGTNGINGGKYTLATELAEKAMFLWPKHHLGSKPYIVCTGGEPLLQLDSPLINALHELGFEVAIETNGTLLAPEGIDWICMSPKPNTQIVQNKGDELKFIYPQERLQPELFLEMDFKHFYLQAMDGPFLNVNIQQCISYCLAHPQWSLSLQTHKILGIP